MPLTKFMQLKIQEYNDNKLITTAPLDVNINDKGTAFGGSLSTITIISSWSLCWLVSQELGFDSKNIVVIKNENRYLKPVTQNIICHTIKPHKEEIQILKEKLEKKGSASLNIKSQIIENGEVCVEFEGVYVIKL
ncbi:YiiD C-terminal domain-containing protein [Arcobacteraceae bacterium]|nr:YiiD C-terminal domain-containing protein [Arcobacteraceae bacterium]